MSAEQIHCKIVLITVLTEKKLLECLFNGRGFEKVQGARRPDPTF